MKGKLINKDQKWIVQYEEVDNTSFGIAAAIGGAIIPSVKELPLHPDDVYSSSLVIGEKGEVEFEIIEIPTHSSGVQSGYDDFDKTEKYAKIIELKEENPCKLITMKDKATVDIPFSNKHIRFENLTAEQASVLLQISQTHQLSQSRRGVKFIESSQPKEEIISMNGFNLKVTKEGIFHKYENITSYVNHINNFFKLDNFGFSTNKGDKNWTFIVKDIVLSKTGCESSETTVSQWLKVWDKYQEFQK